MKTEHGNRHVLVAQCAFEGCANRVIWAVEIVKYCVNSRNSRFLSKRVNFSPAAVKHVNLYQLSNTSNTGSQVAKVVGIKEPIWIVLQQNRTRN